MTTTELTEKFQCPGCTNGSNTQCGRFQLTTYGPSCASHSPGTFIVPGGAIYLGLPRGFSKVGFKATSDFSEALQRNNIRLWPKGTAPLFNKFNVPVWAMEQDGFLFVRTFSPRINATYIDVIESGCREQLCPQAVNAGDFLDEID